MYDAIEARFLILLQGLTGTFASANQVVRGDWRVLDRGRSPMAVLYPGVFQEDVEYAPRIGKSYLWTVNCQLFARFLADGASIQTLAQARDAVVEQIQKYPSLNKLAGVMRVSGARSDEMVELRDDNGGGPYFVQTNLSWQITEAVRVTLSE